MKERLSAIASILLLLFLIGASYYYAVQFQLKNLRYVPSESSPSFTAEKIKVTQFDASGVPSHQLSAGKVVYYSDERIVADGLEYATLTPGKPRLTATAASGSTDDGGKTVNLSGGVTVVRDAWGKTPAMRFETANLLAYPDTQHFVASSAVSFQRGKDSTTAGGMDYQHADGTLKLAGRVRTRVAARR